MGVLTSSGANAYLCAVSTPHLRVLTTSLPDTIPCRKDDFPRIHNLSTFISYDKGDRIMNLTPLHDRVIVKPSAAEEKTAGGLIIPDTAQEKPQRGEIIAVGEGKIGEDGTKQPMAVKVGDNVLYGKYSGTEIQIEGTDVLIMRESDIFAIVN